MIARISLGLILLDCIGVAISHANDFDTVLTQCRDAFGKSPSHASLSMERNRGDWHLTGAAMTFRDATEAARLPIMTDICSLELFGSVPISSEGINRLTALRRLRRLDLSRISFQQEYFLEFLKPLKDIDELHVALGGRVTDVGIGELKGLRNLRSLQVSYLNAPILSALKDIPNLERLDADVWPDAGGKIDLSVLQSLKWLRMRYLDPTQGPLRLPKRLQCLAVENNLVVNLDLSSAPHIEEVVVHVLPPSAGKEDGVPNSDSDLKWLTRLPELTRLYVQEAGRKQVEVIASLTRLRSLECFLGCSPAVEREPMYGEEALKAIAALRELQSLTFYATVTDEEMNILRGFPDLRHLGGVSYSAATANRLGELTHLSSMRLRLEASEGAQSAVLASLATLMALEDLSLNGKVTDAEMAGIRRLKRLRHLDLRGASGFTDGGLAALIKSLPELKTLEFDICRRPPIR